MAPQLPTPSMSATIHPDGSVVIAGEKPPGRKIVKPLRRERRFGHCTACGERGHNSRNKRCKAKKR